jgi:hypothetical protein
MACPKSLFLAALLLCAVSGPRAAQDAQGEPQTPQVELNVGVRLIHAEVAADEKRRMRGLMYRQELARDHGMLFVFDHPERQCMWMRNTYIALSVAFLDESGTIVNVEEMQPRTDDSHCSARPAAYALEMNAGWFARNGARPGMRIEGVERAGPR